MDPITIGIMIAMALASAASAAASASSQNQMYKAQVLNQQRNQASVIDQYRRSVDEATKRKAQEDAQFAQQRDEQQRNKLQALGILENRAGASGQIGNSVDATLGDLYSSIARQENIGSYNEKILRQNSVGEFRELGNSFTSSFNSASSILQKPSFIGQALEVGAAGLTGAASGYQLGKGIKDARDSGKDLKANAKYLQNNGLPANNGTIEGAKR